MTSTSERSLISAVLFVLVALAAASALALGPASRRMPLLVALPTLALLAADWWRLRGVDPHAADRRHGEAALLTWLAGLMAATWGLGVLVGPPLFLAAYLRLRSRQRWRVVALLAGGLWLAVLILLGQVLALPLGGALEQWWRG